MKTDKKSMSIVAMFLIISMIATMIALPMVTATNPPKTWPTFAFVATSRHIVGVGQQVLIIMWIDKVHPTTQNFYGGRWTGYTAEITKPDGTNVTLGPVNADAIASAYIPYTPDVAGNYTVVFKFPEQIVLNPNPPPSWQTYNHPDQVNDTYAASRSTPVEFTVTDNPVPEWSEPSLPTDYWTRPITALNRGWYQIAGDWLLGAANPGTDRFDPYLTGPESAHVLWRKALWEGGIGGGYALDDAYEGLRSEGSGGNPIIINGKAYIADKGTNNAAAGWFAVDLYTGETLYYIEGTTVPSFGSVQRFDSGNGHGAWSYLWASSGTTWIAYDTFTGKNVFNITNAMSSGFAVYGDDGSILRYSIVGSGANKRLTVWNTTQVLSPGSLEGTAARVPDAYSGSYNGATGYSLNVSIPDVQGDIFEVVQDKYVIGGIQGKHNNTAIEPGHIWSISLQSGNEGKLVSNVTFTPPQSAMDPTQLYQYGAYGPAGWARTSTKMYPPYVYPNDNVFVFWEGATLRFWGFSLTTGQQIWGPTEPLTNQFMMYGMFPAVAYGTLYAGGDRGGGEIAAFNITTGEKLWEWLPGTVGSETAFGDRPTYIHTIADGKIYTTGSEHTPSTPLARDRTATCLNATTGEVLWELPIFEGEETSFGLSSGYVLTGSIYDGNWYCIGKGPSATTVSASPKVSLHGSSVLIEGSVTDESPGAPGTAAISDADQKAWMEYLYMQQPMPLGATGVSVSLNALDPNGNFVTIGTATSDASGKYSITFTPQVPGLYTIVASFAGTKSYGSSSAETAISVSEAPSSTNAPTIAPQSIADMYFLPVSIAIIIAIIVVGIVLSLLLLRKRP